MGNALGCRPSRTEGAQPGRKERAGAAAACQEPAGTAAAAQGAAPGAAAPAPAAELPADTSIIFVLGGPGSGKGTQCEKMVAKYGFKHLSAGDLLRAEVASGSEVGQQCEQIMREGKLVPMEVTIGLLRSAMIRGGGGEFLIDGFPRALDQAHAFESLVKPCKMVLAFDCPEEVMEARLLKRGETSGRSDDNAATIRKRFATFVEQSVPVIRHYTAAGKCHNISAVDTPDEVFAHVCNVLEPAATATLSTSTAGGKGTRDEQPVSAPAAAAAAVPQLAFA